MHHRSPSMASECLGELAQIAYNIVNAVTIEGMSLCQHCRSRGLGALLSAPDIRVGKQESLKLGESVRSRAIKALALRPQRTLKRGQGNVNAAVISCIFAG
jgi:hypothetical protein